ncbi:STAS domain-containing protein [Actinoplanes derwentensis]|uniref:Anti-anti-sigma factor n=1 Tax=Actinoplanes derwentensis TaxID=113562 RepID=A0A1H1TC94_9ACTN|nr:STAS domain-containing protein [Actinoplanes derwentensis]GID89480.1 anti-anti-sigma factor [Actinoplanes derwentensis]SDS57596.1 anti-anti-sigma factor [Actinoplanes derwentensis]
MTTALTLTTGPGTVLTAAGEIDMSNAETFAVALTSAVTLAAGMPLTVDLTAVEYLDSAGLAALFVQADHIEVLTGPLLAPLLEISGLAELTTVRSA